MLRVTCPLQPTMEQRPIRARRPSIVMACELRAAHVTEADSCRTRERFRVASSLVAVRRPSQPACATRTPKRSQLANPPGADRVCCACPVQCSHRTWLARIPGAWLVWSRTGSRHAGARSSRALGRRHGIGETQGPVSPEVFGRADGIEAPGRAWLAEEQVPVACSCFRSPPSCENGLRDPRCLPSSFLHGLQRSSADNRLHERSGRDATRGEAATTCWTRVAVRV